MVKGMVCSDVVLKKVSEGSGQKINQIGIELERPVKKMLLKQLW